MLNLLNHSNENHCCAGKTLKSSNISSADVLSVVNTKERFPQVSKDLHTEHSDLITG